MMSLMTASSMTNKLAVSVDVINTQTSSAPSETTIQQQLQENELWTSRTINCFMGQAAWNEDDDDK